MNNFTVIYKILSTLEKALDLSEFDISQIDYTVLNISECRFASHIEMMLDAGYIKGVKVFSNICGNTQVEDNGIRITLKGLEYLQENSIMQKICKQAKGITELIP